MTVDELYKGIKAHLRQYPNISVTWLNRLLAKCNSAAELAKALDAFEAYHARHIDTTAETGTLLIKAACRAGVPERALQLLTNVRDVRLWPTLGGMHYLMINFSLKQDTASVLSTLEATRARRLKPTVRTYHILIRECVDHGHIDRALSLAAQCKAEQLAPNRVMYNILMNGCRKAHKAAELLALRAEMDEQRLDLNETTVKFTVLAHLMLADVPSAVAEFQAFAPTPHAALPFAEKFLEIADEPEPVQHVEYVRTLFTALHEKGVPLEPLIAQLDGLAKQAAAATPAQRPSALEEAAAPAEEEKTANSEPKGRPRSSTL